MALHVEESPVVTSLALSYLMLNRTLSCFMSIPNASKQNTSLFRWKSHRGVTPSLGSLEKAFSGLLLDCHSNHQRLLTSLCHVLNNQSNHKRDLASKKMLNTSRIVWKYHVSYGVNIKIRCQLQQGTRLRPEERNYFL